MDIRLIDRHRNVTLLPKHPQPHAGHPFEVLAELLARVNPAEGQHEFEADGEFVNALRQAPDATRQLTPAPAPFRPGHEFSFQGVPIFQSGVSEDKRDNVLDAPKPDPGPGMPSDNPPDDPNAPLRGAPGPEPTNEPPADDPSATLRGVGGAEPVAEPLEPQEGTAGVRDAEQPLRTTVAGGVVNHNPASGSRRP